MAKVLIVCVYVPYTKLACWRRKYTTEEKAARDKSNEKRNSCQTAYSVCKYYACTWLTLSASMVLLSKTETMNICEGAGRGGIDDTARQELLSWRCGKQNMAKLANNNIQLRNVHVRKFAARRKKGAQNIDTYTHTLHTLHHSNLQFDGA